MQSPVHGNIVNKKKKSFGVMELVKFNISHRGLDTFDLQLKKENELTNNYIIEYFINNY